MPAYMGLMPLIGFGIKTVTQWRQPALNGLIVGAFVWAGAANLEAAYPSYAELSRDMSTRASAESLLREAPPGALILANWHQATPLWYLQLVEQQRPDVDVQYVYPEGAGPMGQVWSRRIAEGLASRPVLVTNHYPEFDALPYRFMPFYGTEEVVAGPLQGVPEGMQPLDILFGDRIKICGYQLADEQLASGEEIVLRLCWQPVQPLDRDYSFFVHLVRELGQPPLGQGDTTHPAARYQVGEVIIDEYRIPLLPTTSPGSYLLARGVYFTYPGGWKRLLTPSGGHTNSGQHRCGASSRVPSHCSSDQASFCGRPHLCWRGL